MSLSQTLGKMKWAISHYRQLQDYVELNYFKDDVYERTIRNSSLFSEAYYRRNTGISDGEDAAAHYLKHWMLPGHDPSEWFCSEEYLSLHGDIELSGMNPLLSYELYGRKSYYEISSLEKAEVSFPENAVTVSKKLTRASCLHRRAAVVACFFSDGHIPETLLLLLKGLREVTDDIVLVGDCPVFPSELEKLVGLASYAEFSRHQQYDFGSYKKGLAILRENGLLNGNAELILVNDSCYGPVFPLSEAFQRMAGVPCDFWGLSGYRHGKRRFFKTFISSYFYVFRSRVLASGCVDGFMERIQGRYDRNAVIMKLETEFTAFLEERGFLWRTLCPDLELNNIFDPLAILGKYRLPLIKKKAFIWQQNQNMEEVLKIIRANNEALGKLVDYVPVLLPGFRLPSIEEHRRTLPDKAAGIEEKTKRGERIKAVFLTGAWDNFPGRFLFERMNRQPAYDPAVIVIPDLRKGPDAKMDSLIEAASRAAQLAAEGIPADRITHVQPDHVGQWPDVCRDADIVVYNSPCGYSSFRYLPRYAAGRDFLPLMACNDNGPDNEQSLDAYRYIWEFVH